MADTPLQVLIVDDHALLRTSIKHLIESRGYRVCGEAANGAEALDLLQQTRPDVVLLDLRLQNEDGLALLKEIIAQCPLTKVLVISSHKQETYAIRALQAGALGYLMKHEATELVLQALESVAKGRCFVPPSFE
jgi:two-component system invasion response regulator UvrY